MNIIQVTISLLLIVNTLLLSYYYYNKKWLYVNCVIDEESHSEIGEDVFYDIDEEIIGVDNKVESDEEIIGVDNKVESDEDELFEDCVEEQRTVKSFLEELIEESLRLVPFKEEERKKRKVSWAEATNNKRAKSLPLFCLGPSSAVKRKYSDLEDTDSSFKKNTRKNRIIPCIKSKLVKSMERRELHARLCKKFDRRRGKLPPAKKVTFTKKTQTIVFCKDDAVVSKPILGKRSADFLESVDFLPKKAKTTEVLLPSKNLVLCKEESVVVVILGKRSADVLDSVDSVPKRAKTKHSPCILPSLYLVRGPMLSWTAKSQK